ncbi:sensor histidine kinase [Halomicronema sp. CCY15110]|uniref:sensor histidine kinase n=1 Tax=Halomicronema sp. CCY15110 TaxID=2767773 RepID=UPI00194FDF9E|nr:ATP-binding protein [Halomicronema sp. CCY15110]
MKGISQQSVENKVEGQSMTAIDNEPLYKKIVRVKTLHQNLAEQAAPVSIDHAREAAKLFRLTKQIRNSLDLETILQTTVDEVQKLLHNDCCYFLWRLESGDRDTLAITHEAKSPNCKSRLGDLPDDHAEGLSEAIIRRQIVRIDDLNNSFETSPEFYAFFQQLSIQAALVLPLETHSGQTGALFCAQCHGVRIWSDTEVELLQALADQVAISIDQAELLARARATAMAAQTQAQQVSEALQKLQQTQAQLVQHEKMSSLGQLVAGVAHEINNPINFIDGNIEPATDYIKDLLELIELYQTTYPEASEQIRQKEAEIDLDFMVEDLLKVLSSMKLGTSRIKQIVLSLRNFSRLDEAEIKPVDLHEGLDNTLVILKSRLRGGNHQDSVQVTRQYTSLPLIECHAGQINQVFMNILSNAIDALETTAHPQIKIETRLVEQSEVDAPGADQPELPYVEVRIRDNGPGMDKAVKRKIFDPFYTTKPVGKGTGLGMSISYQIIVEKHHGTLQCVSEVGEGAEFIVRIPVQVTE